MSGSAVNMLYDSWVQACSLRDGATSGSLEAAAILEVAALEERLAATPASDFLGILQKLEVALAIGGDWAWELVRSAVEDLRAV